MKERPCRNCGRPAVKDLGSKRYFCQRCSEREGLCTCRPIDAAHCSLCRYWKRHGMTVDHNNHPAIPINPVAAYTDRKLLEEKL